MKKISLVLIICVILNLLVSCSNAPVDKEPAVTKPQRELSESYTMDESGKMWAYFDEWKAEYDLTYLFVEIDEDKLCELLKDSEYMNASPTLEGAYTFHTSKSGSYTEKLDFKAHSLKDSLSFQIKMDYSLSSIEIDFDNISIDDFERNTLNYSIHYTSDSEPENCNEHFKYIYGDISFYLDVYYAYDEQNLMPGERSDVIFSCLLQCLNCRS